jgi:hypothetical protein
MPIDLTYWERVPNEADPFPVSTWVREDSRGKIQVKLHCTESSFPIRIGSLERDLGGDFHFCGTPSSQGVTLVEALKEIESTLQGEGFNPLPLGHSIVLSLGEG